MAKFLINVFSVIITSLYFFPIEFIFLPGINTKMVLAGIGLLILGKQLASKGNAHMDKSFFVLSLFALSISLVSLATMTINNTPDGSFLTYFVSIWVWMGGAYTVIKWLNYAYGYVNVQLVCNSLIAVCVMQCIIAIIKDFYPPLQSWVDSIIGGEAFMGNTKEARLSGIGAALDVAGLRFSAVTIMIGYLLFNVKNMDTRQLLLYIVSLFIIAVIGNMISRTTTVGIALVLLYWLYLYCFQFNVNNKSVWAWFLGVLCVIIPVFIYLYNTNENFYENIRFGFEGFFSLWETGSWQTGSNDILLNHMVVFPDNWKTWLIGDGYAANPVDPRYTDPYYTGPVYHGYYMGTDIGYLRFIFYFGIIGAFLFIIFIGKVAYECMLRFKEYRVMFLMILLVNYLVWFKVSSDIFPVFALFLVLNNELEDEKKNNMHMEVC
jgi:hypothetical protein